MPHRIESLLKRLGIMAESLPSGATVKQISAFESSVGYPLPASLRAIYLLHDGEYKNEDRPRVGPGIFCGYQFRSLQHALYEVSIWKYVRETSGQARSGFEEGIPSSPPGTIRGDYTRPGWIPFAGGYGDIHGTAGQVINFGRDDFVHLKIASSFDEFLETLLERYSNQLWHPKFMGDDWSLYDQLIRELKS
jgi:cell wall assembly regulator SMI1